MLCYRCEWRARYLEEGYYPRHECSDINTSKIGCYMYCPCRPVVWKPDGSEQDPRPIGTGLFARRSHAERLSDGKLKFKKLKNGEYVSYWANLK